MSNVYLLTQHFDQGQTLQVDSTCYWEVLLLWPLRAWLQHGLPGLVALRRLAENYYRVFRGMEMALMVSRMEMTLIINLWQEMDGIQGHLAMANDRGCTFRTEGYSLDVILRRWQIRGFLCQKSLGQLQGVGRLATNKHCMTPNWYAFFWDSTTGIYARNDQSL